MLLLSQGALQRPIGFTLLGGLCVFSSASAQLGEQYKQAPTSAPAAAAAPMTNEDVIAMVGLGLSDDIVIAKIRSAQATLFNTSIGGLKDLRAGNVSNLVIRYMVDPQIRSIPLPQARTGPVLQNRTSTDQLMQPGPSSFPVTSRVYTYASETGDPDDPSWFHPPGVYMLATGKDGVAHLTRLDYITSKDRRTTGKILSTVTYGIASTHNKASIDGAHATVQTLDKNPTFYAYFVDNPNAFGGSPSTVRDLTLIQFDEKEKTREINTGSSSRFGASTGNDEKAKRGFLFVEDKPGVYKLTLVRPLQPGQYVFQQTNFGAFYDFGVVTK